MIEQLETIHSINSVDNSIISYLSDYYKINIIILDYYKMNYITGSSFNEDKNNIIIIKNNTYYLPLIHIFKEFTKPGTSLLKLFGY